MAGISPTQRTLQYLRSQGYIVDIVERFNPYAGKFGMRKDMFGFGDIIALGDNSIIAVQSFGQAWSEHRKKLMEEDGVESNVYKWLECGGKIMMIGWRKVKLKRGGKAMRWQPRIGWITIGYDEHLKIEEQK